MITRPTVSPSRLFKLAIRRDRPLYAHLHKTAEQMLQPPLDFNVIYRLPIPLSLASHLGRSALRSSSLRI
jgi:hypothetical protein